MKLNRLIAVLGLIFSVMLPIAAHAATVKVTVNGTQITDTQISVRSALLALEGRKGSNSERQRLATDELIDEALKFQEAERLGLSLTQKEIDDAYLNVARNLKLSVANLNKILSSRGVSVATLKDRLRAALLWQKITSIAIVPRVQFSEKELEDKAEENISDFQGYDYLLKEVLFVMPNGKGSASARTGQANQYRSNFQGCDTAVDLSMSYTDAAVLDIGRRHATQMPEAMAKELAALPVGGITKPRVTERGVSMLAVCSKTAAKDLTFVKERMRQEVGTDKLKTEADAYLARLREQASISYL